MTEKSTELSLKAQNDFATFQHAYIFSNIQAADQKAAIILAIASGLLGYVSSNKEYVGWLKTGPQTLQSVIAAIATIGLVVPAGFALRVLWPNLVGSPKGLIFWQRVASYKSASEYFTVASKASESDITREILHHNFEVSRVCRVKYGRLRCAPVGWV